VTTVEAAPALVVVLGALVVVRKVVVVGALVVVLIVVAVGALVVTFTVVLGALVVVVTVVTPQVTQFLKVSAPKQLETGCQLLQ
jgi:hypothetical protein